MSVLVRGSSIRSGTPYVNGRKQEQPYNVNKVPVPGGGLKAKVLLRREVSLQSAQQADEQKDRSDDDMRTVEARRHEER